MFSSQTQKPASTRSLLAICVLDYHMSTSVNPDIFLVDDRSETSGVVVLTQPLHQTPTGGNTQ